MLRVGDMPSAVTIMMEAAAGHDAGTPQLQMAARRVAETQVRGCYEDLDPLDLERFAGGRDAEEGFLIDRQTARLLAKKWDEPPEDPLVNLYSWAERPDVLRTSPLCHTLLPFSVVGAQGSTAYLRDLSPWRLSRDERALPGRGQQPPRRDPRATRRRPDRRRRSPVLWFAGPPQHGGEGVRLGIPPIPLLDAQKQNFAWAMEQSFHPLPSGHSKLRTQVAMGPLGVEITRHLKQRLSILSVAENAEERDWTELAVACLAYYDVQAEEEMSGIARRIRRRKG